MQCYGAWLLGGTVLKQLSEHAQPATNMPRFAETSRKARSHALLGVRIASDIEALLVFRRANLCGRGKIDPAHALVKLSYAIERMPCRRGSRLMKLECESDHRSRRLTADDGKRLQTPHVQPRRR
jgi:hypothetical protein